MMIVSKQQIIDHGLEFLYGVGTEAICQVCIPNGGSCCKACRFLKNGEGCQVRNTSCTAWLCGFQQYLLFQIGLLDKWKTFWDQVPGQDYRKDITPETVFIKTWLDIPSTQLLSVAFARDLTELRLSKNLNINQFNNRLYTYMEQLSLYQDNEIFQHVLKKLKTHMKEFKHFQEQKELFNG